MLANGTLITLGWARGDTQDRLGRPDQRREARDRLIRHPNGHRAAARLVDRLGQLRAPRLGALRVELDRRDPQPALAESDCGRARPAQLDASILELDEVLERLRDRPE